MLELKHRRACENTVRRGVLREAPTEYCIFRTHKQGGALSVSYIVLPRRVWLGAIFSSTQTAAIFGDKDISKCSYNLISSRRTN